MNLEDTICALATPVGEGALGIIRLSGVDSIKIADIHFSKELKSKESHTLHFGLFKNSNQEIIDEVLVSLFDKGKSFTGEKSVEITCHGSGYIINQIISELINSGARLANAGEFTQRAFLNGKLDLSQAEAVADLIASKSKYAHEVAMNQLRGGLSNNLQETREKLINFASLLELELDFSEEDVEFADRSNLEKTLTETISKINNIKSSFELGNALKEGVPVAIVGAPNSGKSTLLNALLKEDRAIVSDIAGTTRDVIEETLIIEGVLFRLIDTAGIRDSAEKIEQLGIERAKEKIKQAKIVLCISDSTNNDEVDSNTVWVESLKKEYDSKLIYHIKNKVDNTESFSEDEIKISAKNHLGIEDLKKMLATTIIDLKTAQDGVIITSLRHEEALANTNRSLKTALENLINGVSSDFIALDVRQAMFHLGSVTGEISTDDLLGTIFSKFCIGK